MLSQLVCVTAPGRIALYALFISRVILMIDAPKQPLSDSDMLTTV